MPSMQIHTFATKGYLPWLELFLDSLRVQSADRAAVRVDALNFSDEDVARLERRYANVRVHNRVLSDDDIAGDLGISRTELAEWKGEVEDGRVSEKNFLYKIYISVHQRYRALDSVIAEAKQDGYELLIHADSDLYVRSDITQGPLPETVADHDVSFFVNAGALQHSRKVLGAFLCFNLRGNIDEFVTTWMGEIDRVPFFDRWKGFGQSVLWYTMNEVRGARIADLNSIQDRFRYSRYFDKGADMWFGSNSKLPFMRVQKKLGLLGKIGRAETSRARCYRDLEEKR